MSAAKDAASREQGGSKKRSSIQFPYYDLAAAERLVHTVFDQGGDSTTLDQIFRPLKFESTSSGAFRSLVSAARMFGLISITPNRVTLTERGRLLASPVEDNDRERALVEAFLEVPLYARIYEQYKGRMLPSERGLKNGMAQLGVVSSQTDRAHGAFIRSGDAAGFFKQGRGHLVAPAVLRSVRSESPAAASQPPLEVGPARGERPTSVVAEDVGVHAALLGLLQVLPRPGTQWEKKGEWLKAFTATIELLYPSTADARGDGGEEAG